jgi:hypothetical protein
MLRFYLTLLLSLTSTYSAAQFETRSTVYAGLDPEAIAVGDFNRDGKLDLAISNDGGDVTIMLGKGDGTFRTNATYAVGKEDFSITSGSFTKSGTLDLVVASQFNQAIYVLLGNGDGTFQPPVAYPINGSSPAVIVGDFTGDGKLDIAAITNSVVCSCGTVFPGNGD